MRGRFSDPSIASFFPSPPWGIGPLFAVRCPKGERERRLVVATLLLACLCASGEAAAQSAVESFYAGRQVTLILGADSGGGYDTLGRLMARHIGDHIPSRPVVVVQNMPAAGSMAATNHLYNVAAKDGTVIGVIQRGMMIAHLTNPTSVHFDIAKFNWLGSLATETAVTIARNDAAVRTTEDLFTKELIVGGTSGSDPEVTPRLYNALIGTHFKIVNGYTGTNEIALALERGEVQGIGDWSWSSFLVQRPDWLRDRSVRILLQGGLRRLAELPDVPNALDYVKNDTDRRVMELYLAQKEAARPVLAPPGVPPDRLAALRQAFAALAEDKSFLEDAGKSRATVNPTSADSITRVVQLIASTPPDIAQRLADAVAPPKN
jgi:tripartite-type tricarboxylate transporter receptor subunit TctC